MAPTNAMSVLSLALLLSTAYALPPFWPNKYSEKPYPTMTISSSAGVYPTGGAGTTGGSIGTGTGTGYYPTATGSPYSQKRDIADDSEHPYGYPQHHEHYASPTYQTSLVPTSTAPPGTGAPSGTTPSASGTGSPYPTYIADKREVEAAKLQARHYFEGPRHQEHHPYFPYSPDESAAYPTRSAGPTYPTATAPTGMMPTGTTSTGYPSVSIYPYPTFVGF